MHTIGSLTPAASITVAMQEAAAAERVAAGPAVAASQHRSGNPSDRESERDTRVDVQGRRQRPRAARRWRTREVSGDDGGKSNTAEVTGAGAIYTVGTAHIRGTYTRNY